MATSICNFHRKLACKEFKSLLFDEIVNQWSKNDRFYPCKVQLTVRFRIILHAWFRVYQISKSQTNGHSISWFTQHEISARWDYKNTQIWPCYPKSVDTNCQILILDKKTLILILLNKKRGYSWSIQTYDLPFMITWCVFCLSRDHVMIMWHQKATNFDSLTTTSYFKLKYVLTQIPAEIFFFSFFSKSLIMIYLRHIWRLQRNPHFYIRGFS